MRRIAVGTWRGSEAGPMQVVSGPLGRENVHFEAPNADRIDAEMSEFVAWLAAPGAVDPVLVAGIAHFWFVTIHPFEDGNGRIARAIADLALARADGISQRFYSMSAQIELERKRYYTELERGQRGGLDITLWLAWFLECLARALHQSATAMAGTLLKGRVWEHVNKTPVNDRQRKVINQLMAGFEGKLTSSKYAKFTKCSEDTALRDIRILLDCGVPRQNEGGGRSTSYRLADF
jgi:Fic family protein